ncbi:MAG: peroxide stress protein YaaA [Saprospiraceae bacterium]|nr:peroxide stress protein YaaA [Saprospiraceae bacterium]
MITLLSPAKTLDFETPERITELSTPQFALEANRLIRILKKKTIADIKDLMHISDALAKLNRTRFKTFQKEYTDENSKSAITAFKGDVYVGLDVPTLEQADLDFANQHIRILSGLYGLLLPYDRMQPYRLEMGTRLENKKGTNLYHYWGDTISKALNKELKAQDSNTILNLASNEYFKAIDKKKLKANIIDVDFKEDKEGELKFVSFFAKKARGLMARYVVKNKIDDVESIKGFDYENYRFVEELSTDSKLLFVR